MQNAKPQASEMIALQQQLRSPVDNRRFMNFMQKGRFILKTNDLFSLNRNQDVIQIRNLQDTLRIGFEQSNGSSDDDRHDRIIINVSGTRFETFKSTLEKHPNTLLGNAKRRKYYYDKKHQEYFFDRHRQSFEAILYYYQSDGRLRRPNYVPLDTFLEEITFFDLGKDILSQLRKDENLQEVRKPSLPRNPCRRYLWATMEYPDFSFIAKCIHLFSLIIILASTIALAVETLPQFTDLDDTACGFSYQGTSVIQNGNITTNVPIFKTVYICLAYFESPFVLLQTICVGFFTVEFILRCISMPSFCCFIKNAMNWIDLLAIVPYFVTIALRFNGQSDDASGSSYTAVQLLRILRFTRLFKFYRILKNIKAIRVLAVTLKESMLDCFILISILTLLGLLFGAAAYFAESNDPTTPFDSIPIATYWGIITITSVGYGDIVPTTAIGHVIACLCALSGAGVVAMLVSVLVDRYQRVFTRKLYIKPEKIDFDDYSDVDDKIEVGQENLCLKHGTDKISTHDQLQEISQRVKNQDEDTNNVPVAFVLEDSTSETPDRVSFIVSYNQSANNDTSDHLLERIKDVLSDKELSIDNVSLTRLPSSKTQLVFDWDGKVEANRNEIVLNLMSTGDDDDQNSSK